MVAIHLDWWLKSPKAPYSITTLRPGNAFLVIVCEGNPLITAGFLLQITSDVMPVSHSVSFYKVCVQIKQQTSNHD